MKKGIHPEYQAKAVIRCACGNEIVTGSVVASVEVEVCAKCHPFYTGEIRQIFAERGGRVERFRQKYNWEH